MMLFLMFCGSVSTAVSAVRYELKSKSFGQMWFVYASGSDLIESRKTQKSGKRMTTQQRMRIPCLTIDPHGTRRPRGLGRAACRRDRLGLDPARHQSLFLNA